MNASDFQEIPTSAQQRYARPGNSSESPGMLLAAIPTIASGNKP
jgi:hypothetical protein